MLLNYTHLKKDDKNTEGLCRTPKMMKNISEIRLKKVEALTPKSSHSNIKNRLKQVCALNSINTQPK